MKVKDSENSLAKHAQQPAMHVQERRIERKGDKQMRKSLLSSETNTNLSAVQSLSPLQVDASTLSDVELTAQLGDAGVRHDLILI
jgi:hypothetical protein